MTGTPTQKERGAFEAKTGYQFSAPALLDEALTHSGGGPHNERLEFLGDRVLGLVIADELLRLQPGSDEGGLARAFNALVRKEACVVVARDIGLGAMLTMDEAEARSGGRDKKSVLGDGCEALLGAIFLDGGLKAAQAFILKHWAQQIEAVGTVKPDGKTALQEWAHAQFAVTPRYETTNREGPDHGPTFTVEVRVGELAAAQGVGQSKRDAEQAAAEILLRREGFWT